MEVVRQDCDARIAALEAALARATSVDEIVAMLVASLEDFVEDEPGTQAVLYEMVSASHHSDEIRAEMAELYRRWRAHLAEALRAKQREGVVSLDADPEAVASVLFALGDGLGLQLSPTRPGTARRAGARRAHGATAARRLSPSQGSAHDVQRRRSVGEDHQADGLAPGHRVAAGAR